MHYVPESSREFLPRDASSPTEARRGIHYQSAPLYLLTLAVGGLLLVDVTASLTGAFAGTLAGYRWALLAAILGGSRILYHTLDDLFSGRIGAGLALTIAFIAAIWLGEMVTAALVVLITLTGECVERYTIDRAQAAIRSVFDLYPPLARLLKDGREHDCPLEELEPGDVVVVRPGDRIPADGRILKGETSVDQSALTGESRPVEKSPGHELFAGTLNQTGAVQFTVEQTGNQTLLGQVTETVAEAARKKSASERTADRLAKRFLPIVLGAAVLTYLGWWLFTGDSSAGWLPSLGVLVVACPCALVLATPTAVMASLAWLARAGIVVKGSDALERLSEVDTFAFDKTGTLTRGELQIGRIKSFPVGDSSGLDSQQLLYLISIVEQQSEHPLAAPFARSAREKNWTLPAVEEFSATVGGGVSARVDREELETSWRKNFSSSPPKTGSASSANELLLRVGNLRWLEAEGVPVSQEVAEETLPDRASSETSLWLAVDETLFGQVGLQDSVREDAAEILAELKQAGITETVLLTGDRQAATKEVAKSLGRLDRIECDLLPAEKARWIEERQHAGRRVAMVGDGINDAPALVAGHVGIAIARRQHNLAAEAGEIVFLNPTLKPLPGLLRLSRAMVQNIRQSILLFAFGLNGLGMLLCAVGIFSPVAAAVFHELGSLAVMLNALRLLWFEHSAERPAGRSAVYASQAVEWITAAFSPSRWVYRFVDHWNILLRLAAAGAAAWWLVSNVVFLSHEEQALVTRFGKVEAELETGWHWRWPAPFETIYREKTDRLRTLTYGFRIQNDTDEEVRPRVIDWTSPHETAGQHPVPEESLLLTADEVPIELTAEVQYRVADLREFLFGNADPEESLRALAGQTLRSLAAETSLDEILTVGRASMENRCVRQIGRRAKRLKLGVEITAVHLIDVHPPRGVVASYRDVANALEEKEQRINEAQAAAISRLLGIAGPRALAELKNRDSLDLATPHDGSANLQDEQWRNLAQFHQNEEGPRLEHLAGEAADVLLKAKGNAAETRESADGEADRFRQLQTVFRLHPELTSTELYWNTVEAVLSRQPFTILDPKAVGRRHLFLNDSNMKEFAPRLPMMDRQDSEGDQAPTRLKPNQPGGGSPGHRDAN